MGLTAVVTVWLHLVMCPDMGGGCRSYRAEVVDFVECERIGDAWRRAHPRDLYGCERRRVRKEK